MKIPVAALALMLSLSACTTPCKVDEAAPPQTPAQPQPRQVESVAEVTARLEQILRETKPSQSGRPWGSTAPSSGLHHSYRGRSRKASLKGWEEAVVRSKYVDGKNYLVVDMGLGGMWLVEKPLLLDVPSWGGTYLVKPRILGGIDAITDDSGDTYEFMFEKQTQL